MLEKKEICVDQDIRWFVNMRPSATAGGTVIAVDGGPAWPQLTHNHFRQKSLLHRSSHCDFTHLFLSEECGSSDYQLIPPGGM